MPKRILIAGQPKTGKTTLALRLGTLHGIPVKHADDINKTHSWSDQSLEVAAWMDDEDESWIIEGMTVVRAIRKWMERTGVQDKPADIVYWRSMPYVPLDAGQRRIGEGAATVWRQIEAKLLARGVEIRIMGNR